MRRYIPKEFKDLAIHMSLNENVSDDDIHAYIGISQRTMRRLRKLYEETGETIRVPVAPGRPRLLDTLDALVSHLLLSLYSLLIFLSFSKAVLSGSLTCYLWNCRISCVKSVMLWPRLEQLQGPYTGKDT